MSTASTSRRAKGGRRAAASPSRSRPSAYFRRQVWATFQAEAAGLGLLSMIGEDRVMWASDYPHPDSTWPFSQEVVARETAHLAPEVRKKILHDNAARIYHLD